MNTVHILGAGGPAGVGMTRCLKEQYEVTGEDASPWAELMMECEKPADPTSFLPLIVPIADSLIPQYTHISNTFLPPKSHIEICQDKAATAEILGDLAPKTYWVRDTKGAGGSGAQMSSEFLPGANFSHEFVWHGDGLLAEFQKMRLSYSVKSKTQGLDNRGSSAVSVCTFDEEVTRVAHKALEALAHQTGESLHGFYGVDMVEDGEGVPKVTEINAGRLLTASYAFFSETGYNLPLVGVNAYFGNLTTNLPAYPVGWGQIRQVGQLPRLFSPEIAKNWL